MDRVFLISPDETRKPPDKYNFLTQPQLLGAKMLCFLVPCHTKADGLKLSVLGGEWGSNGPPCSTIGLKQQPLKRVAPRDIVSFALRTRCFLDLDILQVSKPCWLL